MILIVWSPLHPSDKRRPCFCHVAHLALPLPFVLLLLHWQPAVLPVSQPPATPSPLRCLTLVRLHQALLWGTRADANLAITGMTGLAPVSMQA